MEEDILNQRHSRLFDRLAFWYSLGFSLQYRWYRRWVERYADSLGLHTTHRILDLGCGTGALAAVLADLGHQVIAADPSPRMLTQARRLNKSRNIQFVSLPDKPPYPWEDCRFDGVFSSLVLHGLQPILRRAVLEESYRLSRYQAVYIDYNGRRNVLADVVEWLEGGDYFRFQSEGRLEMEQVFKQVRTFPLSLGLCVYMCNKQEDLVCQPD